MAWQRAAAIGARPSRVSARTAVWAGVWDGRVGWGALNGMMREVRCGGSGSRVLGAGAREGVAEVAGVHAAAGGHGAAHQGLGWLDAGARGLLRLPRHRRRGAGVRGAPALDPPGDAGVPGVGIAPPERRRARRRSARTGSPRSSRGRVFSPARRSAWCAPSAWGRARGRSGSMRDLARCA